MTDTISLAKRIRVSKDKIKVFHTEDYEIVLLSAGANDVFQGLFTGNEAQGVARAFMSLKGSKLLTNVEIEFQCMTKEEMLKADHLEFNLLS